MLQKYQKFCKSAQTLKLLTSAPMMSGANTAEELNGQM